MIIEFGGDRSVEDRVEYVRMNPVRKGLCGDAEEWPHWVACSE